MDRTCRFSQQQWYVLFKHWKIVSSVWLFCDYLSFIHLRFRWFEGLRSSNQCLHHGHRRTTGEDDTSLLLSGHSNPSCQSKTDKLRPQHTSKTFYRWELSRTLAFYMLLADTLIQSERGKSISQQQFKETEIECDVFHGCVIRRAGGLLQEECEQCCSVSTTVWRQVSPPVQNLYMHKFPHISNFGHLQTLWCTG